MKMHALIFYEAGDSCAAVARFVHAWENGRKDMSALITSEGQEVCNLERSMILAFSASVKLRFSTCHN